MITQILFCYNENNSETVFDVEYMKEGVRLPYLFRRNAGPGFQAYIMVYLWGW